MIREGIDFTNDNKTILHLPSYGYEIASKLFIKSDQKTKTLAGFSIIALAHVSLRNLK